MKLQFCSLNSGSNGNSTYIAAGDTRLLIDAGLSGKQISDALNSVDILPETISGILVTHEHSDHIRGIGVLSRKYRIPVYANEATWERMHRSVGEIPVFQRRVFTTGESFLVGNLDIVPIAIPHDTADPVAFRVYAGGRSVAVATDMGYMPKSVLKMLAGADLVLLEANHDEDLLLNNPRYPESLKRRILSNKGHLSNLTSAQMLYRLYESGVRQALLGHLSEDNNTPELAMRTATEALELQGVRVGNDVQLEMAWRDRRSGFFTLE